MYSVIERKTITEMRCPVCGKIFVPAPCHVYKVRYNKKEYRYACSWHCVVANEKKWRKQL